MQNRQYFRHRMSFDVLCKINLSFPENLILDFVSFLQFQNNELSFSGKTDKKKGP